MNFQEIEKLFENQKTDAVLVTRYPQAFELITTHNGQKLLNITNLGFHACSLATTTKVEVTEQGAAFAVDANGSPVEASN